MCDATHTSYGQHDKLLRALHVYSLLNRGGAETWLMDVVRNMDRDRLHIDVCVVDDDISAGAYEEEFRSLGGRIHRCPVRGNPWRFSRAFRRLLVAELEPYDIVHSHVYLFSGVILRAAYKAGVHHRVAHIHPVIDVKEKRILRCLYTHHMRRWIIKYGTHFVSPTKAGVESFWGPNWQADPTKQVIYNGINVERFVRSFDPTEVRRELNMPPGAKIVLNVSRFAPHKRHGFLVDVAMQLIKRHPDVYFILIGAGPMRDDTIEKVSRAGLTDHFRFIAGEPDIDRFWLSADVFAFPSSNEGFGIVVAEAAAAGLPVVAQDIPGVQEAETACHDSVLLSLDTGPDQWSTVLEAALNRGRLSDDARRQNLTKFPFTIQASVKALENLYNL